MRQSGPIRCPGCGAPLASVVGDKWADVIRLARTGSGYWQFTLEIEGGEPVLLRKTEKIMPGRGGS
ncbi:MAG: hypothetical protein NTW26_00585 [bacterium]|nr:hypothetical protein [bacterium]